jgi:hypothetical protein
MTLRAAGASTSTCCGKWAAPSASCTASSSDQGHGRRRDLRRRDALQAVRDRGAIWRLLSSRSSAPAAPFARCGSAPIPRQRNGWRRWSTKIPGWRAGITAFPTPKIRLRPEDPYPRVKALRDTMREGGIPDELPIVMAGGVWYLRDWERLDRQSRTGPDRLPVRYAPAADAGKPDPAGWKDQADQLEEGDVLLAQILADRFLFKRRDQSVPARIEARSERQIPYSTEQAGDHTHSSTLAVKGKNFWVTRA